jgi:DNA-binding IclR family transcriptional regulator
MFDPGSWNMADPGPLTWLTLGRRAIVHDELACIAAPWVSRLGARTGHVATLSIPCYAGVVCVLHAGPEGSCPR